MNRFVSHFTEIKYLAIFLFASFGTVAVAPQIIQNYQSAAMIPFWSACQALLYQSGQSSRVSLLLFLSAALFILVLRAVATIFQTIAHTRQLRTQLTAKLPKRLTRAITELRLSPSRIRVARDRRFLAYTYGFFQPTIILSSRLVSQTTPKQLQAVLLHEHYHATHLHPFLLLFGTLTSRTLFFLPILSDLVTHMRLEFECAADRFVTRYQNTTMHLRATLKLNLANQSPSAELSGFSLGFGGEQLTARILQVSHPRPLGFVPGKLHIYVSTLLLGLVLMAARPAQAQLAVADQPVISRCSFVRCVTSCVQDTIMSVQPTFSPAAPVSRIDMPR